MKIIKTELVYVPKDLCSNALVSRMSINDKDTITDTTILVMTDCYSVVRLPYLNLNVMFYEVDCMTITNSCTRQQVSIVLCKNPIERKKLTNYINIDEFSHSVAISDQATHKKRGSIPVRSDSMKWHDIIAIINRFDSLNRRWVVMWSVEHCDQHVRNCGNIRNRQSCIVTHSSCNMSGELEAITTDNHVRRTRNYYQRVYFVVILKYIRLLKNKVKTK